MKVFYLAHPFSFRYDILQFQKQLEKKLKGTRFINPFFNSNSREKFNNKDRDNDEYYKKIDFEEVVRRDLELIAQSEAVLAIVPKVTIGTLMEMAHAYNMKKPIYTIMTNGQHNHPFIRYHSSKVFSTRQEFLDWVGGED